MMRFDRRAPGEGLEAECRLHNGKVHLRWKLSLSREGSNTEPVGNGVKGYRTHLRLVDKDGNLVAECAQDLQDEEPAEVILLRPNLWRGVEDAYLYELRARIFASDGRCEDSLCRKLAIRELVKRPVSPDGLGKVFLNGERFVFRGVRYDLKTGSGIRGKLRVCEDMERIRKLGANCILVEKYEALWGTGSGELRFLLRVCEEKGILALGEAWVEPEEAKEFPLFRGAGDALVSQTDGTPTARYYQYAARWSRHPFLYIVPESIRRMDSGNYQVTCYSNQSKVALYSGGNFFELKQCNGEVCFWEIPVKGDYLQFSAEADGCSTALSLHRIFTKSSLIGDN